ncbi:MAG: hypothetical protein ACYC69_07450 [Thermodesulfovibrionales bacterium]
MNYLSEKENKLIARLEAIPKVRTAYIIIFIGFIICCWIYFIIRHPLLANPFFVLSEFRKGTYPKDIFIIIAVFSPVLFSLCWLLLLFNVVFGIGFLKERKQLLEIIRKLKGNNDNKHA